MKWKLVWFILAVAFLLRFVSIGNIPAGLNADEASFGYDAYSILNTGRDQWGNMLPIVLKSFGDFKSPVYSYLSVPSVAIFGLNTFATRLPNVIIGTLAVLATYLLASQIGRCTKWVDSRTAKWLPLVASGLVAVNPWSVMMSRGATEFNLTTLFLPLAIYFFLKGLSENKYFMWAAFLMGINMFTYHSAKVVTPLVFIGLVILFRKEIQKINLNKYIVSLILFLVFFTGMLYTFKIGGGTRVAERSITQGALEQGFQERVVAESRGLNPKISKIIHNRYQVILSRFISNYLQYFSPKFLVNRGVTDASYAMLPGIGVIYFLELILLLGIIPLFLVDKKSRSLVLSLLVWLIISPLPAALASGAGYSGNRASGMLPILQICEAYGLVGWSILIRRSNVKYEKFVMALGFLLLVFNMISFKNSYFKTHPVSVLKQQGYGYIELGKWLEENTVGRQVYISRSISEAQIFIAFSQKWNPSDFQRETGSWKFDEANISWVDQLPKYQVGRFVITSIDWKKKDMQDLIVVVKADEMPQNQIPIKTFYYPNGDPNIYVIDQTKNIYAKAF